MKGFLSLLLFPLLSFGLTEGQVVDAESEVNVDEVSVTIGTGGVTGVYYPLGGSISRLVNRDADRTGIRCSVEATDGSVFNVNAVKEGELDFGVAQSDVQYEAFFGRGEFEEVGPFTKLRSLFSIHSEPFTIVARRDSGIQTLEDLKGKRVNIGNSASGQRAMMQFLMEHMGWTEADFFSATGLSPIEQVKALAENEVDAIIFTVGHPGGSIQEAIDLVDAVIIPVKGDVIDAIIEEYPFYTKATIPGGLYKGNEEPVPTFGVRATMITTAAEKDRVVRELVRAVFENFDTFRRLHPAFSEINREEMVKEALSAPLHPAARAYYIEKGLIQP